MDEHCMRISVSTQIIFGVNTNSLVSSEIEKLGGKQVFLITDEGVSRTNFFMKILDNLTQHRVEVEVFSDVESDPSAKTVEKAFLRYSQLRAPVLLAIGGGSPMDTAKAIGILATNGGRIHEYEGINMFHTPPLPLIAIPTTAGTGSEVSSSCSITDTERGVKMAIRHAVLNRARVAILDPLSLISLPAHVAAHTGMDAFVHALESYISLQATPLTDGIDLYALELIAKNMRPFLADRGNLEAGGNMLAAASLAAIGFSHTGAGNVHCMARLVGAFYHVPHGLSNAVCLPYVVEFNMSACPEKFARVAQALGIETHAMTTMEAACAAISAIKSLCEDIGIPKNLKVIGVKEEAIPKMAQLAFQANYNRWNPRYTTEEDFLKLFQKAMG
jgi:alcohol dehydrogenase